MLERTSVDDRFCGFAFVKADAWHSRWTMRLSHLDLRRYSFVHVLEGKFAGLIGEFLSNSAQLM
jgi:hypothetical protein